MELQGKLLGEVAEKARLTARKRSTDLLKSYLDDRNPHLINLGINDYSNLPQEELIKKLEAVRKREKQKVYPDWYRYTVVSTALVVEKERNRSAMDITLGDFSDFLRGVYSNEAS